MGKKTIICGPISCVGAIVLWICEAIGYIQLLEFASVIQSYYHNCKICIRTKWGIQWHYLSWQLYLDKGAIEPYVREREKKVPRHDDVHLNKNKKQNYLPHDPRGGDKTKFPKYPSHLPTHKYLCTCILKTL